MVAFMQKEKFENENLDFKDLYPELTDEELKEAEENLERYLEVVMRIYERIRNNPEELRKLRNLTKQK